MVRPKEMDNVYRVAEYFVDNFLDIGFIGHFSKSKISIDLGINPKSLSWILNYLVKIKFLTEVNYANKKLYALEKVKR